MPPIATTTLAELDGVLEASGAKMQGWEVHALYLGALTSTSFGLGPQRLLHRIYGDTPVLGDSVEQANERIQVLFGYWNHLVAERDAGRVHLAAISLPEAAGKDQLLDFVARRQQEMAWYVRGIDAGGDHPMQFGSDGQRLLEEIAKGSAFLDAYKDLLDRTHESSEKDLRTARTTLCEIVGVLERLIADLMSVSDLVRREAVASFDAQAGRSTDDGAQIAKPVRVGRNAMCPCGSGKKWKRCCGAPSPLQ
jgi:hypothetical protein